MLRFRMYNCPWYETTSSLASNHKSVANECVVSQSDYIFFAIKMAEMPISRLQNGTSETSG